MGHGIKKHDTGFVWGDTWHKKEQYARLDRPVFFEEALSCFDYEKSIEIIGNPLILEDGTELNTNSNVILRRDKNIVLNGSVGNQYTLCGFVEYVKTAYGSVIQALSDDSKKIEIESVGTLDNGAIQFISLVFDRKQIHGDDSPTLTRLMITNDYQGGGVKVLISQIRVVCKNTRAFAIACAKSIRSTRHTTNVNSRVKTNLIDMAVVQNQVMRENETLDLLAKADEISLDNQKKVLNDIWNVVPTAEAIINGEYNLLDNIYVKDYMVAKNSRNAERHDKVLTVFHEGQEGLDGKYAKTPYAFFNAITNVVCREEARADGTDVEWDNLTGKRAVIKEKALKSIVGVSL